MAASVVEPRPFHRSPKPPSLDESSPGVLPSSIDSRGRPLATEVLTTTLLRKLSLGALRAALGRMRRPAWDL